MIRCVGVIFAVLAVVLAGCKCGSPGAGSPSSQAWTGPVPTYEELARAYNTRVDPLNRLTAAVVLRLDYRDDEGVEHHEQVEGRCEFVPPRQFVLTLRKVSQDIAILGSDPERFWWIELGDRKRALVGDHETIGADRLAAAGVPVHPLDLIELMGITPLPLEPTAGKVAPSPDGLVVTLPGRIGSRRMIFHSTDYRPARIELLREDGRVAAGADLSKYARVAMSGAGPEAVHPWIATDAVIVASGGTTHGHLELATPEIDPSRPRPGVFDLAKWLRAKGVEEVLQLGEPVHPQ